MISAHALHRHPNGSQITIILLLLSRLVGWHACIAGFLTSLLLVPVASALMRRVASVRQRLAPLTDARVKLCSEIVAGEMNMKLIRLGEGICLF